MTPSKQKTTHIGNNKTSQGLTLKRVVIKVFKSSLQCLSRWARPACWHRERPPQKTGREGGRQRNGISACHRSMNLTAQSETICGDCRFKKTESIQRGGSCWNDWLDAYQTCDGKLWFLGVVHRWLQNVAGITWWKISFEMNWLFPLSFQAREIIFYARMMNPVRISRMSELLVSTIVSLCFVASVSTFPKICSICILIKWRPSTLINSHVKRFSFLIYDPILNPNTKMFKQTFIYFNTDTQYATFRQSDQIPLSSHKTPNKL